MSDSESETLTISSFILNHNDKTGPLSKSSSSDDKFRFNQESFYEITLSDKIINIGKIGIFNDCSDFKMKYKRKKSREGHNGCCGVKSCIIF